jgi:hypothetical protein
MFPLRQIVGEWYSQEHGDLFLQLACGHSLAASGGAVMRRRRCALCAAEVPTSRACAECSQLFDGRVSQRYCRRRCATRANRRRQRESH